VNNLQTRSYNTNLLLTIPKVITPYTSIRLDLVFTLELSLLAGNLLGIFIIFSITIVFFFSSNFDFGIGDIDFVEVRGYPLLSPSTLVSTPSLSCLSFWGISFFRGEQLIDRLFVLSISIFSAPIFFPYCVKTFTNTTICILVV